MDRIIRRQGQTAPVARAEIARQNRAVLMLISAVVFWHVAVSCMVLAKAMAPSKPAAELAQPIR